MNIAFFCFFEKNRISGPSNSITMLSKELSSEHDIQADVFTTSTKVKSGFKINSVKIRAFDDFFVNSRSYDLVVLSGLFDINTFRVALFCVRNNIKYILSPRSNLMKEALKKSFIKKKLALCSYAKFVLNNAASIHFLNVEERNNSLDLGVDSFISRNGLSLINCDLEEFNNRKNQIVFIGRLDVHHKGIDLLIDAIHLLKHELIKGNWQVFLIGPDSVNNKNDIYRKITFLGLENIVKIISEKVGVEKQKILMESKVFVHPSRYEGQPQSVIEAMSCGLIPVVTPGSNMMQDIIKFFPISRFEKKEYSDLLLQAMNNLSPNIPIEISNYARCSFTWQIAASEFMSGVLPIMEGKK